MADPLIKLGNSIRARRKARGLKTLADLQTALHEAGFNRSQQHLSRVELGRDAPSPELAHALDALLGANGEFLRYLRDAKVPASVADSSFRIRARLLYPARLASLPRYLAVETSPNPAFEPCQVVGPDGQGAVGFVFPFSVLVVVEDHSIDVPHLHNVIQHRRAWIEAGTTRVGDFAREVGLGVEIDDQEPYCLVLLILDSVLWPDRHRRDRATQLLAQPFCLDPPVGSEMSRDEWEELLLNSADPIGNCAPFTTPNAHTGWAAWAGVAIACNDDQLIELLTNFELKVQALWCYSVNASRDVPACAADYDDEFVLAALRQLALPSATEHTVSRTLREAVIRTSQLSDVARHAADALLSEKARASRNRRRTQ